MLKFADEAKVHELLDYPGLVAAMRRAHAKGQPLMKAMMVDSPEGDGNRMIALLGWNQDSIAVKVIGVYPSNLNRTPPQASVQGVVIVFNPETGTPLLVGDGSALTVRKTAADSALGSQFLSREDAEVLLVVGAGGLGPHVAMAHTAIRPSIRTVRIWNRTPARAKALEERAQNEITAHNDLYRRMAEGPASTTADPAQT